MEEFVKRFDAFEDSFVELVKRRDCDRVITGIAIE
jgi:hypothetical protein